MNSGNICRSPIAEAVFIKIAEEKGVADKWEVDSAAIGSWHIGKSPDPRARAVLQERNIPYNNKARQIKKDDYNKFDFIFGMDYENIDDLKSRAPPNSKAEILLLGDFDPKGEKIIRDPYYVSFFISLFIYSIIYS